MLNHHKLLMGQAGKIVYPTKIEQSALIGGDSSEASYLERPVTTQENIKKMTVAFWLKHPGVDPNGRGCTALEYSNPDAGDYTHNQIYFGVPGVTNYGAQILMTTPSNATVMHVRVETPEVFLSDPTGWKHYVITIDSTEAVATDRLKMWMNGKRLTNVTWVTQLAQDADLVFGMVGATKSALVGCSGHATTPGKTYAFVNTRFAEYHCITGEALDPEYFGQWSDAIKNLWVPKGYTGTYGTNGFYLNFDDDANLGKDISGNSNDFTVVGSPVQTLDTPTNNHCTLNPLNPLTTGTLSEGNLTMTGAGVSSFYTTFGVSSGRFCATFDGVVDNGVPRVGVAKASTGIVPGGRLGDFRGQIAYGSANGYKFVDGVQTPYGDTWGTSDSIDVCIDFDAQTLAFYKNGVSQGDIDISTWLDGELVLFSACEADSTGTSIMHYNNASSPLEGFSPLCAANLPEPEILDPATGNDVVLYNGTGYGEELCVGGTVTDSGSQSGRIGANAFDNTSGTNQAWQTPNVFPDGEAWVAYELPSPVVATRYFVRSGVSAYTLNHAPKSWTFEGFNGGSWDVLHTVTNAPAWAASETRSYEFANSVEYTKYRWTFTATHGHANLVIDELDIFSGPPNKISDMLFQPDYTLIKGRTNVYNWRLADSVRDANNILQLNTTAASTVLTDNITAFLPDGFSLGDHASVNAVGQSYLAQCLKRGPEYGFDIVHYTGDGVAGRQIAHNCGGTPEMLLVKALTSTGDWAVYHAATGATKMLVLNSAAAAQNGCWNSVAPTETHFTVGSQDTVNKVGVEYIAYVFRSIPGFSKVFSYESNNSADGPFVKLGFRPKAIMGKDSKASENWFFIDLKRDPHNKVSKVLYPDLPNAEVPTGTFVNFCSNGFKPVTAGIPNNVAGNTIIGIAWAEQPFKYSNAF